MNLPPLVTGSPAGTAPVLGSPDTNVLFGGDKVFEEGRNGYRVTMGVWLDECCKRLGIEADFFALEDQDLYYRGAACGRQPVIGRPFYDALLGVESAELVNYPGLLVGCVEVEGSSSFQSAGIRLRRNMMCDTLEGSDPCDGSSTCGKRNCNRCKPAGCFRLDLLAGYRYYNLEDDLSIHESLYSTDPGGLVPIGTTFDITDRFQTSNEFHGGEVGLVGQINRGRWSLELMGKVAVGNNAQMVRISGQTIVKTPGTPAVTNNGGLLALPTNIGVYERNEFSVIPQFSAEVGYQVSCNFRVYLGYNFLYWSNVLRAGDQIDTVVNRSQLPPGGLVGAPRPAFTYNDSSFWAQGLNTGLELRF